MGLGMLGLEFWLFLLFLINGLKIDELNYYYFFNLEFWI